MQNATLNQKADKLTSEGVSPSVPTSRPEGGVLKCCDDRREEH
jgi:hypothetical protein